MHGKELIAAGADIIDIGGESTRPGSVRVSPEEEKKRVLPVIEALAAEDVIVSVDTLHAEVAQAACAAGAHIINDVSGGLDDPDMVSVAAQLAVPIILGHWRGHLSDPSTSDVYSDVVSEVHAELGQRLTVALEAGVKAENIILDPGFGFSKGAAHNWRLLAQLESFVQLPYRVLVGVSRKRFIADLANPDNPAEASLADRDTVTAGITAYAAQCGVWAVRVHEPRANALAVRTVNAVAKARTVAGMRK